MSIDAINVDTHGDDKLRNIIEKPDTFNMQDNLPKGNKLSLGLEIEFWRLTETIWAARNLRSDERYADYRL